MPPLDFDLRLRRAREAECEGEGTEDKGFLSHDDSV
jgi:hypothetical protein